MRNTVFIFVVLMCLAAMPGFTQTAPQPFRLLGIRAYSGELRLRGFYRDQLQSSEKFSEHQTSYYYAAGIFMNASTYLVHPNFCELELGAGYMPESNKNHYLSAPDFSEVRTVKNINFSSSFFKQKKVSVLANGSYDESYARRESMTDIRTVNKYIGGSLIYSNKYIPLNFDFYKRKLDQTEVQSGRRLKIDQIHFEGRADQSFSSYDHQKLVFSHKVTSTLNENDFLTSNTANDFYFNSNFALGEKRVFNFNTTINNNNQHGIYDFNRFQAMEDLFIKLPLNFTFRTNYNYYNISQPFGRTLQHISTNYLEHQLYKSLHSRFYFEVTNLNNPAYAENNSKTGFDFNYTKKIPWGSLQMSYGFFTYRQNFTTDSSNINILREEYKLSDSKIVLLRRPYIDQQTVVVKDATGTIIYQPGLDYFLVEQGKYLEIRRIPSGQIPNDGTVFVDYRAKQPNSYKYAADNHIFTTNVSLLKGKLDIYYRLAVQNYRDLENTDYITLNYFTQHVAGFRLGYELLGGGIEYEDYKSSILPYRLVRYYISAQKCFRNKVTIFLNGNMQNYTMLNEPEARVQRYADVTAKVEYAIARQTRVNLDVMYRKQQGRGIDLDLLTARLEFTSVIYRLYVTAGLEVYRRNYVGEKINFKGTYIQISRKF